MIKLLRAGGSRLIKNKLFLILTAFSMGLALLMIYIRYRDLRNYGDLIETEQLMLNYATIIGIVIAIFTSLFWEPNIRMALFGIKLLSGIKECIYTYLILS